jgi:diacylglycerol kinase (ATP)
MPNHNGARKALVIYNPSSGKTAQYLEQLSDFQAGGSQLVELTPDVNLEHLVQDAVIKGFDTVVAAGGDGTVNAVVNALMSVDAARRPCMGILPLGTANDFALTLAIPADIPAAIDNLMVGHWIPMDVIRLSTGNAVKYFANVAAGGNSVRVTEEMTPEMKSRWGAFCYLRGAVPVLADLQSYHIELECDGEALAGQDSWAVLVANGRTNAGGIVVAPPAQPHDGLMDVVVIRNGTVLDIMAIVGNAMLGDYLASEQVIHRQVKQLRLRSEPEMRFTLDGEVIDELPLAFDIVPGAIRMFVGDDFLRSVEDQQMSTLAGNA